MIEKRHSASARRDGHPLLHRPAGIDGLVTGYPARSPHRRHLSISPGDRTRRRRTLPRQRPDRHRHHGCHPHGGSHHLGRNRHLIRRGGRWPDRRLRHGRDARRRRLSSANSYVDPAYQRRGIGATLVTAYIKGGKVKRRRRDLPIDVSLTASGIRRSTAAWVSPTSTAPTTCPG